MDIFVILAKKLTTENHCRTKVESHTKWQVSLRLSVLSLSVCIIICASIILHLQLFSEKNEGNAMIFYSQLLQAPLNLSDSCLDEFWRVVAQKNLIVLCTVKILT